MSGMAQEAMDLLKEVVKNTHKKSEQVTVIPIGGLLTGATGRFQSPTQVPLGTKWTVQSWSWVAPHAGAGGPARVQLYTNVVDALNLIEAQSAPMQDDTGNNDVFAAAFSGPAVLLPGDSLIAAVSGSAAGAFGLRLQVKAETLREPDYAYNPIDIESLEGDPSGVGESEFEHTYGLVRER